MHLISGSADGSGGGGGGGGPGTTMQVPDDKVGSIIGRQGASINAIQQRTGCRVQIPRECTPGSMPPTRTVSLTGRPEACAAAMREIEGIVSGFGAGYQQGGFQQQMGGYGAPGGYHQQQQQPYGYQQQYQQQQPHGYQQQMGGYGAPGGYHQQQQQQAPQQGGAPPPPPAGAPMAQMQQHAAAPAGAAPAASSAGAGGAGAAAGGAAEPTPAQVEAHRKAWEEYYKSQGYAVPQQ